MTTDYQSTGEHEIKFVKTKSNDSGNFNPEKIAEKRQEYEKNRLKDVIKKALEEGKSMDEALDIATRNTGKRGEYKPRDGERGEYKPRDGERREYKPRERSSFDRPRSAPGERREYKPRDGERREYKPRDGERRDERRGFGDQRPERREYKPRNGSFKNDRNSDRRPRDSSRDKSLVSDLKRKIEILQNAKKIDENKGE